MYPQIDGEILYAIIRHAGPGRVVEIGAGWSSRVIADALDANAGEGTPAKDHRIFDPFPAEHLRSLGANVETLTAEEIPLDTFASLEAGDVLVIDTTHTVKPGNDVLRLILEVLPTLASGVVVHFHDVFLPFSYPEFMHDRGAFWQEQYLVQAFLAFNPGFDVLMANYAILRLRSEENRRDRAGPLEPCAWECPVAGPQSDVARDPRAAIRGGHTQRDEDPPCRIRLPPVSPRGPDQLRRGPHGRAGGRRRRGPLLLLRQALPAPATARATLDSPPRADARAPELTSAVGAGGPRYAAARPGAERRDGRAFLPAGRGRSQARSRARPRPARAPVVRARDPARARSSGCHGPARLLPPVPDPQAVRRRPPGVPSPRSRRAVRSLLPRRAERQPRAGAAHAPPPQAAGGGPAAAPRADAEPGDGGASPFAHRGPPCRAAPAGGRRRAGLRGQA